MGILEDLLGEGRRRDFTDLGNQYEQGHPAERYSGAEDGERYRGTPATASFVPDRSARRTRARSESIGPGFFACAPTLRRVYCRGFCLPANRIVRMRPVNTGAWSPADAAGAAEGSG